MTRHRQEIDSNKVLKRTIEIYDKLAQLTNNPKENDE